MKQLDGRGEAVPFSSRGDVRNDEMATLVWSELGLSPRVDPHGLAMSPPQADILSYKHIYLGKSCDGDD